MPLAKDSNQFAVQLLRPGPTHYLTVSVAAAATPAISQASAVRIAATVDCRYGVGSNPTATSQSTFLPAGTVDYIGVTKGIDKVSVIRAGTVDGNVTVTEMG